MADGLRLNHEFSRGIRKRLKRKEARRRVKQMKVERLKAKLKREIAKITFKCSDASQEERSQVAQEVQGRVQEARHRLGIVKVRFVGATSGD